MCWGRRNISPRVVRGWSFGVVVREMLMAVNGRVFFCNSLFNLKVLRPICCVSLTVLALGLY